MFVYIYKLIKKDAINDDMIYIGSSKNIKHRMDRHKHSCNNIKHHNHNLKVYKYIRENGGWDAWTYEIIDEVEVALRNDVARYEGEYIIKYDTINKLNMGVAGRTKKEYSVQNVEKFKEYYKEYNKKNTEKLKEYNKEYNKKNKDLISEQKKEKYERNKEQINQKRREQRRLAKLNTL